MILLSAAEARQADVLAAARGVSGASLMEKAGEGVARAALREFGRRPATILCGPGQNGGDGFVAARHLKEAGLAVRVGLGVAKEALTGDAALMAGVYDGPVEALTPALLEGTGFIVDALFGAGLSRAPEGRYAAAIDAANAHPAPVLAVDLPSGVLADTGQAPGSAIRAARTVTFFARKPAHVLFPGRALCGAIELIDIGIPAAVLDEIRPTAFENAAPLWGPEFRQPNFAAHKYLRGHAVIVSGGRLKTGAARLAARAALRVGAGLVTVLSPPDASAENAAHLTAVMLREIDGARALSAVLADERITSCLIGPGAGVGADTAGLALAAIASKAAVVLDADALTSFEDAPQTLFAALRPNDVLTPHGGEFSRIFKSIDAMSSGRLEAARMAARTAGAVVVLKGADSVIAAPDGRAAVNVNAPPDLATAGSGDVLAGFVAGLRAQGMPGFEAAAAAVWLHGACGQQAGPGLVAEDLPAALPAVLRALLSPPPQASADRPAGG